MKPLSLHGTCVEINGKAVMITGKPGVGKSSLALQLMDRGAVLVADDQSILSFDAGKIIVHPPETLKGLLEVRGVGIMPFSYREKSPLTLCVEICEEKDLERLPNSIFIEYYNIQVPLLKLKRFDPLGAIKVELKIGVTDEAYVS